MMMQEQPMLDMNGQEGHHTLMDRRLAVEAGHMSHHSMDDEPHHLGPNHHPHHMSNAGSPPTMGMWPPNHLMMSEDGNTFVSGGHHPGLPHHPDMIGGSSASSSSESSVSAGGIRGSPPLVGPGSMLGPIPTSRKSSAASAAAKKGSSRRNAWGNLSYADLITQAIQSAPEKRLTLSQVYEWMVANIPYFKDKGDSNSSAGWKNSIRHNLSLHSRFIRVQNEGTGKSSWWMLNPDAKPGGKTSRRRTPSVDGQGNPIGPRGLDNMKRRGRSKKPGGPASGNRPGNPRNGLTPSPGLPPPGVAHLYGMSDMYEESRNIHSQYPFPTDLRSHLSGNGENIGRMSPPPSLRGDGGPFNYPGQEWAAEYPQCGIQGYYPGNIPRSFCDQICPDGDYNCPRPGSPSALIQAQARANGYRHYPSNGPGDNFHSFQGHEGKMPGSPIVGVPPHSLAQDCTPHPYSNIQQVMSPGVTPNMSPSCQRPGSFPSPDPPSQTPGGEQQPILSPHPLHHGQTFFPNCNMGKNSQARNSSPPPTTPTSKACSNASILERALGTAIKQEHHVVTSAVMSAGPGQWSHLSGQVHGGFSEVNVDDFMKAEAGIENMDYMYHTGGQGAGQNASPNMAHLPPPPHTPGTRPGDGGQYHHNLSNWVR